MRICNDSEGNIHIDMSDPNRLELHSFKEVVLHSPITRDIGGFPEDLLKECGKGGAFDMILAFSDAVEKIKEDY